MKGYAMKFRILLATLFLISVSYILVAIAEPLDTYTKGWNTIRATADEDGATFAAVYNLALNDGDFASKGTTAFHIATRRNNKEISSFRSSRS